MIFTPSRTVGKGQIVSKVIENETTPLLTHLPDVADKTPINRPKSYSPAQITGAEARVREIAENSGYSKIESDSLIMLLRRESGVNPNAVNKKTHACGLFQRLPCPWKITQDNGVYTVHASIEEQMENGLAYIKNRYTTASAALKFQRERGWY